jgi:flagellar hook-associated protein 2
MGTVGLNFGSATSGQGFDVTSTVNQIVTNLQAVEAPWKNQLTCLQGRDTALSNLGTLISSLSTDLQNLRDFNGVLAAKTGSSSDTSVLNLSSASATAVAGTHTVSVQNLAQTASAASDPIAASDALTGGITFKVGDGVWQTVNVGDSGTPATLAGMAAAINGAGLGATATILTNADGSERLSMVSQKSGSRGQITIADATNNPASPTTLADATTPDKSAGLGLTTIQAGMDATLTVDGVKLTNASNTVTNAIPGVTFQILSTGDAGSTSETVQVVIANDNASIESEINTFVTDYNATMKAINAQETKDSSGNPGPLYGTSVLAQLQQGLQSVMSQTFGANKINGLISLGISASATADGTVTLNTDALYNALNMNFSQVLSLFQDVDSFGWSFAQTLNNVGNTQPGGAISLALGEDASQEKALNDNIGKREELIATQKANVTTELNLADRILQSIPEQIQQINEMYSAITGYNGNQNG